MNYKKSITIHGSLHPRQRPTYENINEGLKLLKNQLADDFQQEIKDRLLKETIGNSRYPLSGHISLYVELRTSRQLNICGVLKNIMDACNGIILKDDSSVESALINRYISDYQFDNIKIWVISGKPLVDNNQIISNLSNYTVLFIDMDTVAEDTYLPYPPNNECGKIINPNRDDELKELLLAKCKTSGINGGIKTLSLTVNLDNCRKVDIDNLCLNYIVNLKGIAYDDLSDISSLHMRKVQGRGIKSQTEIRFK